MRLKRRQTKAKPTRRNLSRGHKLLRASLATYRHRFSLFGPVVLIAIIVDGLIRFSSTAETAATYQSLWFVFVSCGLIWAIRHSQAKTLPNTSQVYWNGTAAALKFLIVLSLIALVTIPFSVGAFIFSTVSWLDVGGALAGEVIAGGIWLALALISLLLLARLLVALVIVTLPDIGPMTAIKLSWRVSKGRVWAMARRLLVILAYLIIILGGMGLGLSLAGLNPTAIVLVIEVVAIGFVMPLFYIFLFKLYKELA